MDFVHSELRYCKSYFYYSIQGNVLIVLYRSPWKFVSVYREDSEKIISNICSKPHGYGTTFIRYRLHIEDTDGFSDRTLHSFSSFYCFTTLILLPLRCELQNVFGFRVGAHTRVRARSLTGERW